MCPSMKESMCLLWKSNNISHTIISSSSCVLFCIACIYKRPFSKTLYFTIITIPFKCCANGKYIKCVMILEMSPCSVMILQHSHWHKTSANQKENVLVRIIVKQRNVNLSVWLGPGRLQVTFYSKMLLQGTVEQFNSNLFKFYDNENV
jgi:hypothetical protein